MKNILNLLGFLNVLNNNHRETDQLRQGARQRLADTR